MTEAEQDHQYRELTRTITALKTTLASVNSKIKSTGDWLVDLGKGLQENPPRWNVDRPTLEIEVFRLWDLMDQRENSEAQLAGKQAEFDAFPA